jgi:hypothetical protein
MKSTNRKGAKVAETNAEFFSIHSSFSPRFSPRTLHLCVSFYPAMPTQYFLFVMANGISAKVHKSSLIQSIKMRLPYLLGRLNLLI